MGPYCNYCDHRCFVLNPRKPGHLLATCVMGQGHDKEILGYCYGEVVEEVVNRKVTMTFEAIEGEDLDTHVTAALTKAQQDAIWRVIYGAAPVTISSRAVERPPEAHSLTRAGSPL